MIPEPAKARPYVAGEHSRESLRYGTATHICNAHIPFEGVGAALAIGLDRLAQRLVRDPRALQ